MESSVEIESLVNSVHTGDTGALKRLFAQYQAYLKKVVAMRMDNQLQTRLDASDIVQEVQLEALRRADDYAANPVIPVRLWLRRIACDRLNMARRKHLASQLRSVDREQSLPEDLSVSIAQQLIAGVASPSAAVSQREVVRLVRTSIAQLEEDDREVILLHAFEGLNSNESAQVLGIEPASARKRYGRALRRLQQKLVENGLENSQS